MLVLLMELFRAFVKRGFVGMLSVFELAVSPQQGGMQEIGGPSAVGPVLQLPLNPPHLSCERLNLAFPIGSLLVQPAIGGAVVIGVRVYHLEIPIDLMLEQGDLSFPGLNLNKINDRVETGHARSGFRAPNLLLQ